MRVVPESVCDDLQRIIPSLIQSIPSDGRSTRIDNQIRILRQCLKRVSKAKKVD